MNSEKSTPSTMLLEILLYSTIENIVRKPIFDQTFTLYWEDLGSFYTPRQTQFKFWAPISQDVSLHIEDQVYPMNRTENGVWELVLKGDWEGAAYHYEFRVNGLERRIHDPYALSSLANSEIAWSSTGRRSHVLSRVPLVN